MCSAHYLYKCIDTYIGCFYLIDLLLRSSLVVVIVISCNSNNLKSSVSHKTLSLFLNAPLIIFEQHEMKKEEDIADKKKESSNKINPSNEHPSVKIRFFNTSKYV